MDDERAHTEAYRDLIQVAERLESMAETATLMDDRDGALRLRSQAHDTRLRAMALLDD